MLRQTRETPDCSVLPPESARPACWSEYLQRQTMVINEYRLDLLDPQAQEILTQDAIEFLGLEGEAGGTETAESR